MDARYLIRLQVELEYQLDAQGQLVPFPGSSEQARYIVYHYKEGYARFYRCDLPAREKANLETCHPSLAFGDPDRIWHILGVEPSPTETPVFASGIIPDAPPASSFPEARFRDGVWVIDVEGRLVAWAWSARMNEKSARGCAELAVEVDEAFRRRGFGRQVSMAWSHQVIGAGQIAFYSFKTTNQPSQALALSLGVRVFAYCVAFG